MVEEDPASGEEVRTLRTLGPGEGFGELGLAEGAARGATVRAAEDSELFEIDKGTFDELLADTLRVPRFAPTLQAAAELGRIPAFGHLQPDELGELLRAGRWVNVPPGAVMVEQGAVGDAFFAISSGQVQVFENGTNVRNLGPGSHFGEIALLLDVPRTATVKAMTPVRAFRLEREGFDGLLRSSFQKGTLDPILPLERVLDH